MTRSAESYPAAEHRPHVAGAEGCLEILSDRLYNSPGIVSFVADFREGTLTVQYEPSSIEPDRLNALADEVATLFAHRVTSCERRQSPGACDECALRLGRIPQGPGDLDVISDTDRVGLSRRSVPSGTALLVRPIPDIKRWGTKFSPAEQEQFAKGRSMAALTGVCFLFLALGIALERWMGEAAWHHGAYALSALSGSWFALRSTARALLKGRLDVNLLMILAAVGAAVIGYVLEAAVLMFLFSLSNTLEIYTMGRTRRAIHALLKLRPSRALVKRGEREMEVDAETVQVGERVIIRPGESFPIDGVVVAGASLADQSMLTGESVPVTKEIGDRVFAGTLNQQGSLEVRASRQAGDTTLARIVALVEEAQEQKSRTEELADWVGRYYTIVVVVAAAAMIVIPPLFLRHDFINSFYRAMTLLVVASPCALVIATPATVLSAIANAARNGILFKGGRFLEGLGRVRAIGFDKTGTLTRGRFAVTEVLTVNGASEDEVLAWAASAEKRSQHPLAQAVVREAAARSLVVRPADQLTNYLGKGVVARRDGTSIEIGTPELFAHLGVAVPEVAREQVERLSREARTSMLVRCGPAWGVIAANDELRPAAAATVRQLRESGVRSVVLLSGDSEPTVAAVARRAGVDEHYGGLLPEDKVRVVGELERRFGAVAMVGDGVNDAPALARATVGVAMGGVGSDAAMESADVVLMGDDLTALPYALRLARRARRTVVQNVAIASSVMLVLVLLVFFGHLTPLGSLKLPVAVSGHEGSTVVVILNGLRLLRGRRAPPRA